MRRHGFWVFFGLLLGASGCAKKDVVAAEPQEVRHGVPWELQGPHIPAGTEFSIRLDHEISTTRSAPGQTFSAEVVAPVHDSSGRVLIKAGGKLHGRVVNVETGLSPKIVLDFSTLETTSGLAGVEAKIVRAETDRPLGPLEGYAPEPLIGTPYYDPNLGRGYPYDSVLYTAVNAREIRLPINAKLRLILTRPLLPPARAEEAKRPSGCRG